MADLAVELYGTRVGVLTGPWRTFDFVTDPGAAAEFGIDSTILSVAIPPEAVKSRETAGRDPVLSDETGPEAHGSVHPRSYCLQKPFGHISQFALQGKFACSLTWPAGLPVPPGINGYDAHLLLYGEWPAGAVGHSRKSSCHHEAVSAGDVPIPKSQQATA
ncbi:MULTISPECIES: hypothetical protein [unclassified Frankia]|uniref:hypothetical protein n=1 Tax=unclassified Frankia TaxID=2632575 RepID=UPI002024A92F